MTCFRIVMHCIQDFCIAQNCLVNCHIKRLNQLQQNSTIESCVQIEPWFWLWVLIRCKSSPAINHAFKTAFTIFIIFWTLTILNTYFDLQKLSLLFLYNGPWVDDVNWLHCRAIITKLLFLGHYINCLKKKTTHTHITVFVCDFQVKENKGNDISLLKMSWWSEKRQDLGCSFGGHRQLLKVD